MGKYHAGTSFFKGLLYLAIIVFGGIFVAKGNMNVEDLAVYALYIGIFITPVEVLINFTEQFQDVYKRQTAPDSYFAISKVSFTRLLSLFASSIIVCILSISAWLG